MYESVFLPEEGRIRATPLAAGPWDPAAQHGGAPAALLMRAFEALPAADGLQIVRVTLEFLRPVPVGLLDLSAEVVRPGRRVQLAEASIRDEAGTEVVRARCLQVTAASMRVALPAREGPPDPPGTALENDLVPPHGTMFAPDAIEIRFVRGSFRERGPATGWFRLRVPLVPGESATPLQTLAAASDFGNGISFPLTWDDHLFINPDLTIYVERPPEGEWICLESETRVPAGGIGVSESVLYDHRGRVGRAVQSLVVAPR